VPTYQIVLTHLNLLILFLTLVVLIFYTIYTRRMQQAVVEQTKVANRQIQHLIYQRKLSVMPAFHVCPIGKAGRRALDLHNIGNGVAINVTIDPIPVSSDLGAGAIIKFGSLRFVKRDTSDYVTAHVSHDLESREPLHVLGIVDPLRSLVKEQNLLTLTLRFQDVDGTRYAQDVVLGVDENKLISTEFKRPVQEYTKEMRSDTL
jgi:hypothetical protein